jgi:hypothetical protein
MTGFVLALAGLTAGDSGPGVGAAREAVAISFEGIWVGTVEVNGGRPLPAKWDNDAGAFWVGPDVGPDGGGDIANFARSGPGAILVTPLGGTAYRGTYSFAGDRLILRFAMKGKTYRYDLRRATPRDLQDGRRPGRLRRWLGGRRPHVSP